MKEKCTLVFVPLPAVVGDMTVDVTCYVKDWPDFNLPQYKRFVKPSLNLDAAGLPQYPKVKYTKVNVASSTGPNEPMVIKEAQYEKFQKFIDLANKDATD